MEQRIGRYQIVREIASGGQATVYLARDDSLGRNVAIKVLHPHLVRESEFLERFDREAQTAASISHPNITVIYEVGEDAGKHFIAMEYLPNTLNDLINDRGKLPVTQALSIARQVALALQEAHEHNIVHRDLKPQNILMTTGGVPKVTDFGIAWAAQFSAMTNTGMVMGTPQYMSPEQARGATGEHLDGRSDVYGLGIILFQMLTGHTPLEDQTPLQVISHHINRSQIPLDQLNDSNVSPAVVNIVRRALARERGQRYQSAAQLAQALEKEGATPGATPKPDRRRERSRPRERQAPSTTWMKALAKVAQGSQRRNSGLLMSIITIGVLAAVGVWGFGLVGGGEDDPPAIRALNALGFSSDRGDDPAAAVPPVTSTPERPLVSTLPGPIDTQTDGIKRVLFDEGHDEQATLSLERALELNGEHPEWFSFREVAATLGDNYAIDPHKGSPLTLEILQEYDALVLAAPKSQFSEKEIKAVHQYLDNGGGLVVLGNGGLVSSANSITDVYGISFNPQPLASPTNIENPENFFVYSWAEHEVATSVPFLANWSQNISVEDPAEVILSTNSDTWQDTDNNKTHDASEPSGPFAMVAVSEIGQGRIVAIADNSFHDSHINRPGNILLIRNALDWVTGLREETWVSVGDMTTERGRPTATLLAGDTVLVVGRPPFAEIYDPATQSFQITGVRQCAFSRIPVATMLANRQVLFTGGESEARCAEVYDPQTQLFTRVGDLNADHTEHTATLLLDGRVLVVGGKREIDGGFLTHDIAELYDPETQSFQVTGSLNQERKEHAATLLPTGQVLLTGGIHQLTPQQSGDAGELNCIDTAEIYDPATDTFSITGQMSHGACSPEAVTLNDGTILVTSGSTGAQLFDPATETFRAVGDMNVSHARHTITLLSSGHVLIVGGWNPTGEQPPRAINTVEIYDPSTGTFSVVEGLKNRRFDHTAILLSDNTVLVIGGSYDRVRLGEERALARLASAEVWIPGGRPAPTPTTTPTSTPLPVFVAAPTPTATPVPIVTPVPTLTPTPAPTVSNVTPLIKGAWNTVGNMVAERVNHNATLLTDGRVLVSGAAIFAEIYDPATRSFAGAGVRQCTNSHDPIATLLMDGNVLMTGGAPESRCAEIYDSKLERFIRVGDLNADHFWHTATLIGNGEVLIAGGLDGDILSTEVAEIYDPVAQSFRVTGSLNKSRKGHSATLLPSGSVLVTGGFHDLVPPPTDGSVSDPCLSSAELYDPVTGTFSPTSSMDQENCSPEAVMLNDGNILITSNSLRAYLFDPSTETFLRVGNVHTPHGEPEIVLLPSGRVLVIGGYGREAPFSAVQSYNPSTGTFALVESMNEPRAFHTATLLADGSVLVVGGTNSTDGSLSLTSAELWVPALESSPAPTTTPTQNPSGEIVFHSNRDGDWEIYVMDLDGSNVVQLTFNDTIDAAPAWSPSGEQIVFSSDRNGTTDIYVMAANGENVTQLTFNDSVDVAPSWSPSGEQIAFSSDRDGDREIYVIDVDGSNVTQLTFNGSTDLFPAWSPDGSRIVFSSDVSGLGREVFVVDTSTGIVTQLTSTEARDHSPSWSPDGSRIIFSSNRGSDFEVYAMDANGNNVIQLTFDDANDTHPSWSPDGQRIIFRSNRTGDFDIYVMDADGGNVTRLTSEFSIEGGPDWR